jgi:hypothetical protein
VTDRPASVGLDIHHAAGLIGAYCAIERRLFEFTGAMATEEALPPEIQLHLDAVSAQHAWHAELWADRLPVTAAIDSGPLVALPPALEGVMGDLSGLGPLERLAGLFRVLLPRLVVSYSRHAAQATPATDAPTARALSLVLRDEIDEWVGGESLVERVLGAPEAAQAAARTVVDLEIRLIAAGIVPGLVPWPGGRG